MAEELHTPPEHPSSLPPFNLGLCCVIFSLLCSVLWTIFHLFVPFFLLTNVLFVLQCTTSDDPYRYFFYISVYGSSITCLYITSILMYETISTRLADVMFIVFLKYTSNKQVQDIVQVFSVVLGHFYKFVCLMVFNATFNNISVISWRSVLLVEETGGPGENHAWNRRCANVHLSTINKLLSKPRHNLHDKNCNESVLKITYIHGSLFFFLLFSHSNLLFHSSFS